MLEEQDPKKERLDFIFSAVALVVIVVLIVLALLGKLPMADFPVP